MLICDMTHNKYHLSMKGEFFFVLAKGVLSGSFNWPPRLPSLAPNGTCWERRTKGAVTAFDNGKEYY